MARRISQLESRFGGSRVSLSHGGNHVGDRDESTDVSDIDQAISSKTQKEDEAKICAFIGWMNMKLGTLSRQDHKRWSGLPPGFRIDEDRFEEDLSDGRRLQCVRNIKKLNSRKR